jgi:hypothetical protein
MIGGKLSRNIFWACFLQSLQYAIDDEKVYRGFKYVSIKSAQTNFHKCITWLKNMVKVNMNGTRLALNLV